VGNVWEWTAEPFAVRSLRRTARAGQQSRQGHRLLKGGSHLCHKSYCFRYRIAARSGNTPDSTTTHQGFRVVWEG
jgi:formylglycine-generating enzyme required for sulfatase activity